MPFPTYVPLAVQAFITSEIEGSEMTWEGWGAAVASSSAQLSELKLHSGLRGKLQDSHDWMVSKLESLLRLGKDGRMRAVYEEQTIGFSDEKWRDFISAAWSAREDYDPYRTRNREAAESAKKVAEAAADLRRALREFSKTGVAGPREFHSLPINSDNPEEAGPSPSDFAGVGDVDGVMAVLQRFGLSSPGGQEEFNPVAQLRYSQRIKYRSLWFTLEALENAARDFKPREHSMIGAAIDSRQRNVKTEYLRAFISILTADPLLLTKDIKHVIAIVATVVINDPDNGDVTYDDVEKTVVRLAKKRPENAKRI